MSKIEIPSEEQQRAEIAIAKMKKFSTAILPLKQNGYFYIVRHVTEEERIEKKMKEGIKYQMVTNTRFTTLDKAAREMVRLCKAKGYVVYEPPTPEPKYEKPYDPSKPLKY